MIEQHPEAEAIRAAIIGNDRQALDPRIPYGRDKAFGITRKPETAGHDRHAVEHQAIKRRWWRGIDLARHLVLLWLARGLQISRATWKPANTSCWRKPIWKVSRQWSLICRGVWLK